MPFSPAEKEELRKQLGAKLKEIRESKGLTLDTVAAYVGKNPQSIHRAEKGQVNPSYIYLLELCEGLEIDIADLMKGLNS
jgi:putative transcriptional regulator